jgi:hypothetical protein
MAGERSEGVTTLTPVVALQGAHDNVASKGKGRVRRKTHMTRSITNLLYPETGPYGLISSGSFDGYVFARLGIQNKTHLMCKDSSILGSSTSD